ncbi:hypothetical protein EDB19DRAFT_1299343 [Suillus lakei]|nr:hypothetical protein EDB19DRAFT_1299343 [Suillus lakei]
MEDLLVFSHLQHRLLGGLTISLNNALCKELAIEWPDLVELYFSAPRDPMAVLFSAPSSLSPPQPPSVKTPVDLGRLVTFAKHCPNLSRLHLSILSDTTELPALDDTLTTLSSSHTLRLHADIGGCGFISEASGGISRRGVSSERNQGHTCCILLLEVSIQIFSLKSGPCYRTLFVLCVGNVFRCDGA